MKKVTVLLASNSLESLYHCLVISMDAKALGWEAKVFVTSNAVVLFTKRRKGRAGTSMGWLATIYIKLRLRRIGVSSTTKMLEEAMKLGVKFYVDEVGLRIAGMGPEDLMEGVDLSGGVSFLKEAAESDVVVTL